MAHSVAIRVNTLVAHSTLGALTPTPSTLPNVLPVFIQDTPDATFKYAALGYNGGGWNTALADVYARTSTDFTVTHWNMHLSAALGVGEQIVFRFVIDGTPDATLNITIPSGSQDGSATGTLDVSADADIAIEAVVTGSPSAIVRGGMMVVES